jgi:hypothetical protein
LFPWSAFVFAGAVLGVVIDSLRAQTSSRRLHVVLAVSGGLMVWLAHEASFRAPLFGHSDYWTTSASFLLLRVGLLTLILPLGYVWAHAPLRHKISSWSPLEELGRSSLFVYWVHVEMVYGFFSRPIRRSLTVEGAVVAYVLFTVFLWGLVRLKNWVVEGSGGIYLTDSKSVI